MTERLSPMDASYLAAARTDYLAGARLLVFGEPAPGFEACLEHVRDRLPMVPRLRDRVRRSALAVRRPRWQRDPHFDLRRHVRPMPLPSAEPGAELEVVSGALLSQPLDLRRPPWELWYFEGLPGGRFAVGAKFHHSLADGDAGDHLLAQLFPTIRAAATDRRDEPGPAREGPRTDLVAARKSSAALARPRHLVRRARRQVRRLALSSALAPPRRSAPETPLNRGPVGRDRSIRLLSMPLADVRLAKAALETTVNSLLVAAVAGALRGYFARQGLPAVNPVALVPVSLREPGDLRLGNRVRSVLCHLPVAEPDALERLRRVTDSLAVEVSSARAAGERLSVIGPQAWRDYVARRRSGERVFNLIVTNSIGSTVPHQCCGRTAELMLASGPNIPFDGPVIRVSSYLDSLTIAITVDPARIANGGALAVDLRASLDELLALARHSAGDAGHSSGGAWFGTPWPPSITSSP